MPLVPPTTSRSRTLLRTIPPLLWHFATGQPQPVSVLARNLMAGLIPPPLIEGTEHIPPVTPFITLFNHYEDPRVATWWGGLLIARAIAEHRTREPREVHFLVAKEWWYAGGFGRAVKQPATHAILARAAQVYGLVRVPPVLEGDVTRGQGVAGVRHGLALMRGPEPQLVGLAPEGHAGPGGALKAPPPGAGLFLLLLTHDSIPCLPAGWWPDEEGRIRVRFGGPFLLAVPRLKDRPARDRAPATEAMLALGRLLPPRLWGAYAGELAAAPDAK